MEPNDVLHTEDQELHLTQEPVDARVSRWGMVLLSMVWGIVSVTTKEIVPPNNEPKTVPPFRLISFSFFTPNNKRVTLAN